jgi:hypothetical protein
MIDGPWTYYLEVDGPRDRGMTCNETVAWQVMES